MNIKQLLLSTHELLPRGKSPEDIPHLKLVGEESDLSEDGLELPLYDAELAGPSEFIKPIGCNDGTITKKRVRMDDGTEYDVLVGIPHDQRSDTAIGETTAWWTHPQLEHNLKSLRSAVWLGYPSFMVGPPIGFNASDVSVSKVAYDMNRIADHELANLNVDPLQLIVKGASRAAVSGIGMSVPQYAQDRKIVYVDAIAPSTSQPFSLREWPGVVWQVKNELVALVGVADEYRGNKQLLRCLLSLPPRDLSHIPNALRVLPGLVNGEAGKLADASDPSTAMHIVQFTEDKWAKLEDWETRFQHRSNVHTTREPGNHVGGIGSTKTRHDTNVRLAAWVECRGYDGSFNDLDFINDVLPAQHVARRALMRVVQSRHKVAA